MRGCQVKFTLGVLTLVPLKRRGLATNPSVCRMSLITNSMDDRTVEMIITLRSLNQFSNT